MALLAAALAVPLATYGSIGAYSRYTADDYCWAGVLRVEGFWGAQAWWFNAYSPRYAFTLLVNFVELFGPGVVPLLPTLAILTWLGVLTWTLRQFSVRYPLVFALTIVVGTLHTAPDIGQSLYWQTAMLTYLLPLIMATFVLGWIRRATIVGAGWGAVLVSAAVTFFAGGLSETYLIPQNVALTLALAVSLVAQWRGHNSARPVVLTTSAALAGGVLALATILLAPATASRVGGSPADLWLAVSASIGTGAVQAGRLVRSFAPTLALCVLVPWLLAGAAAHPHRPRDLRPLALVTLLTAIVVPFCYFPSFFAQNGNPPARSLIVPGSLFIGWAVFAGYSLRGVVRLPDRVSLALVALCMVVPLGIAATTWPERATAAEYAAMWDAEDRLIRDAAARGVADVVVPPLPRNFGEAFVTTDPEHFFNRCVARYYGVETIAASS